MCLSHFLKQYVDASLAGLRGKKTKGDTRFLEKHQYFNGFMSSQYIVYFLYFFVYLISSQLYLTRSKISEMLLNFFCISVSSSEKWTQHCWAAKKLNVKNVKCLRLCHLVLIDCYLLVELLTTKWLRWKKKMQSLCQPSGSWWMPGTGLNTLLEDRAFSCC